MDPPLSMYLIFKSILEVSPKLLCCRDFNLRFRQFWSFHQRFTFPIVQVLPFTFGVLNFISAIFRLTLIVSVQLPVRLFLVFPYQSTLASVFPAPFYLVKLLVVTIAFSPQSLLIFLAPLFPFSYSFFVCWLPIYVVVLRQITP